MTYEQRQEAIKAIILGDYQADAASYAGVSVDDVKGDITPEDIDNMTKNLKEMGWI